MYDLIIFLVLLSLGYGVGQYAERRHYRSIIEREGRLNALPAIASRYPPIERQYDQALVIGSTVVSVDYFKRFLAALRNLFGGRVTAYESLLDRARREALLRMKEMAGDATVIVNVRIETSAVGKQSKRKNIGCLEAMAYGTALMVEE